MFSKNYAHSCTVTSTDPLLPHDPQNTKLRQYLYAPIIGFGFYMHTNLRTHAEPKTNRRPPLFMQGEARSANKCKNGCSGAPTRALIKKRQKAIPRVAQKFHRWEDSAMDSGRSEMRCAVEYSALLERSISTSLRNSTRSTKSTSTTTS